MTVELTPEEIDAIEAAVELARDDQSSYLQYGGPERDYDDEWPSVARRKSEMWDTLAGLFSKLGLGNQMLRALAEEFDEAARVPDGENPVPAGKHDACEDMPGLPQCGPGEDPVLASIEWAEAEKEGQK